MFSIFSDITTTRKQFQLLNTSSQDTFCTIYIVHCILYQLNTYSLAFIAGGCLVSAGPAFRMAFKAGFRENAESGCSNFILPQTASKSAQMLKQSRDANNGYKVKEVARTCKAES